VSTFRFRAAAVLDLRLREEQAATALKTQAEARFAASRALLEAEETRRRESQDELVATERRGADVGTVLWHRNWIVRLAGSVDHLRRELQARAQEVGIAEARWRDARRKRLAIERLRDRAWRRFQRDEGQREQKAMDELARIRHVMPDAWRTE
jgi:flagellar export protein FliJ